MDFPNAIRMNVKGNAKGFALVEVLIASAIFGIFMTAIVSMTVAAVKTNDLARDITEATSLASDVIERISLLDYDDAQLQGNSLTEPEAMDGKYSFAINTAKDAVLDNTMLITVTVNWKFRGIPKKVVITDIRIAFA
jgi:prepilin-type N-terminal cleavage/methylation domain-containing protein